MTKQTTVRLPDELAHAAEAVAQVKGTSVNALIVESLAAEVERVRRDKDFTARAKRLLDLLVVCDSCGEELHRRDLRATLAEDAW